jgi:hypothetical protein
MLVGKQRMLLGKECNLFNVYSLVFLLKILLLAIL